jgi:glycosyltransferase involved in cell wall biosynthesis
MPSFNAVSFIEEAINSVIAQTLTDWELIVVDNFSKDGTVEVVQKFNDERIVLHCRKNDGVIAASRNYGISMARGKYVAFLDADDYWDEGFLMKMNDLYSNFPEANVFASNYRCQDHTGAFHKTQLNRLSFVEKGEGILNNYFEVAVVSSPPLWSSAIVIRKKELLRIGGFPLGVKLGEDLITWAKVAINNKIAYITKPLATYTLDPTQSYEGKPNRIPQTPDHVGDELKKLYKKHKSIRGLKEYKAHWHKMRASIFLRLGNRTNASLEIVNSLAYNPFQSKVYIYCMLLFLPNRLTLQIFKRLS